VTTRHVMLGKAEQMLKWTWRFWRAEGWPVLYWRLLLGKRRKFIRTKHGDRRG